MIATTEPRAWASPVETAAWWPKLRLRKIPWNRVAIDELGGSSPPCGRCSRRRPGGTRSRRSPSTRRSPQAAIQLGQVLFLVEDRHDDREERSVQGIQAHRRIPRSGFLRILPTVAASSSRPGGSCKGPFGRRAVHGSSRPVSLPREDQGGLADGEAVVAGEDEVEGPAVGAHPLGREAARLARRRRPSPR